MLILGVDTSGKNGGIALVEFAGQEARTVETAPLEGGTFSAQLIPQISAILKRHNLTKNDIEGLAVVSGPGSFTGLRVGLAAIKALAEVLEKPIAAVSLLEAIVRASGKSGELIAALEAGRCEAYVGEFVVENGNATLREQRLVAITELVHSGRAEIVTSDVKIADAAGEKGGRVMLLDYPKPDLIARLGFEKIQAGETTTAVELDANYIRRSDAEIKFAGL
jgi:tRNA threonylcarbamoyladenosine biosynthesis protein TsaB